jgi:hypothetical protein
VSLVCTRTCSLVDGADTAALVLAADGILATAELADPSAAPECCIVGAKGQPLPPRTASLVAFQTSSVEHPDSIDRDWCK